MRFRVWMGILIGVMSWLSAAGATNQGIGVFRDLDGQARAVDSYTGQGHWLVVLIWGSDCHVCNAEVESYAALHRDGADKGIRVLGVSLDGEAGKAGAVAFVNRHHLPFPNLLGEPREVALYYLALTQSGLRGTPSVMVFDPSGALRAAQAGAIAPAVIEGYIAKKKAGHSDG